MIDFIVGFFVAVLSGLGIGGGGLLVIWQVLVRGVEQLEAQGVNLVYFLFSSGAAMLVHMTKRRLPWRLIGALVLVGAIGALAGSALARAADPGVVRKCFGWLLVASGVMAIGKK
ncbi:MAG: sulfite exporter TauE/SafE family protein [Clostridia bacterium]|nr:sulfite exporter TauE/SafE family protein [Clostridia bacterium]